MQGVLYLVGTPIGNLGDFSPRGVETLSAVDFIAAEDTRVTQKLLNRFNIKKNVESYFEYNKKAKGEVILGRLLAGESCALVTDAGMPAISDPGEDLVALCAQNRVEVRVVPGPCAAVSAVAASALPSGRFCFEGFLSVNKKSRREHLESIRDEPRTMVFYEAPHKLRATLSDLFGTLGDRRISIVREMTKIHEETLRMTLSGAMEYYSGIEPKGEFVLVIEGKKTAPPRETEPQEEKLAKAASLAETYISQGSSRAQAVKRAAKEMLVDRAELYRLTLTKNK